MIRLIQLLIVKFKQLARDFTGTTQCLWAIGVAVHLALLGPVGMRDLGTTIMQRSQYAANRLGEIPGVRAPALSAPFFKEFVVDLNGTGRTVAEVNRALATAGIHGPLDLSQRVASLGQSALVCVTEVHTQADIDLLADSIAAAIGGG